MLIYMLQWYFMTNSIMFLVQIKDTHSIIIHSNRSKAYNKHVDFRYQPFSKLHNIPTSDEDNGDVAGFDLNEKEMLKFKIWNEGIIPYFIDDFSFDKVLRDRIRKLLSEINTETGLQFTELPKPPDDDITRFVFFINRIGLLECLDYTTKNFTVVGIQRLVLGYDCLQSDGALAAAVLALVGVPPQHNAPDRDEYIQVNIHNILPDKIPLFKALEDKDWLFHGVEYDFTSASHYDFYKYTQNGGATIEPKEKNPSLVGDVEGFSSVDILKIKYLYNYIKRKSGLKPSQCSQLFQPGANFKKIRPDEKVPLKPRKKPNRYQGLPEEKADESGIKKMKSEGDINSTVNIVVDNATNIEDGNNTISALNLEVPTDRMHRYRGKSHRAIAKKKLYYSFKYQSDFNTVEDK